MLLALAVAGCSHREEEVPLANLAVGKPVSLAAADGPAEAATDGRLAPEGSAPEGASVTLAGAYAELRVDLGSVQPVGALLIQADAADVYFVETSTDATLWQVSWRVAPLHGVRGLRTRTTALDRAVAARWLRIRATTFRSPAVSEIQAFPAEPYRWPAPDRSGPNARLPLWPELTRDRLQTLYAALAAVFLAAAVWNVVGRASSGPGERRGRRGLLLAVAAVSLIGWPNFLNFHYYGLVHTWDVFHYYMGAKYLRELGYTRLYACAAAVDAEDGIDLGGRIMRDLRSNRLVPATAELALAEECHARFSKERWGEFRHDARFFREAMGLEAWLAVRNDHGFNGTPAWAVVGGLLAGLGPAGWPAIRFLALLDIALVIATFTVLARGFGTEAAFLAAGYWGVNALSPFGWTGGGFLRYDWLFWLIAGIAALRRGRPVLAGFALGYATLLRVFPICAVLGLALKVAVQAAAERSGRPLARLAPFAVGAMLAALLFAGGSAVMTRGFGIWGEFADNSAKHLASQAANFVSLETLLAHDGEARVELMTDPRLVDRHAPWRERLTAAERALRPARWAAATGFLLLLALAVRRALDWEAAMLGLGLMPMCLKLSSYYYAGLIAYASLSSVHPGFGLGLAWFAWGTNVIAGLWSAPDVQHARLSLAVVVFVSAVTAAAAWRRRALAPTAPPANVADHGAESARSRSEAPGSGSARPATR